MIDAAGKAHSQMFTPALRHVLLKAVGLALILIVIIGILMHRLLAAWAEAGANWAEQATGVAPHAAWATLAWVLSIMASLGIITGALFLMPAVTAFVGSFFVDEIAEAVERESYPGEMPGRAVSLFRALIEGLKFAALAIAVIFLRYRSCYLPGWASSFCFSQIPTFLVANILSSPPCGSASRTMQRRCANQTRFIFFSRAW